MPGSLNPTGLFALDLDGLRHGAHRQYRGAPTATTPTTSRHRLRPLFQAVSYPDTYHQYPRPRDFSTTDSKGKKQTDGIPVTTNGCRQPGPRRQRAGRGRTPRWAPTWTARRCRSCRRPPARPRCRDDQQMVPVYRGGTIISLGLQAGWWTISQNWRGYWGDPNMPLDNNTPYMKKVIVLMTDGNNEWNDWNCGVRQKSGTVAQTPPWMPMATRTTRPTAALNQHPRGLSTTDPTTTLNKWMSQMCTAIKQNGIIIYTILFNNSTRQPQPCQELRLVPQQLLPEPHRHRSAECLQADRQRAVHLAAIAIIHPQVRIHHPTPGCSRALPAVVRSLSLKASASSGTCTQNKW